MSHELRTPLNVIMGYTGIVQGGMLGEIKREQSEALEKALSHSRDLLSMIDRIMQATQIEAHEINLERAAVSLSSILDGLRSAYEFLLNDRLTLIWDYPSDLPVLQTDGDKLKHILQNLIDNAVKFTEEGWIKISARNLAEHKRIIFEVADTGIGVAKENLPVIFDMFRQVDGSATRRHEGIGLGLYIVKKYVGLLGGKVNVESEPGKGSTFTITIPSEYSDGGQF
jgi:signal transduction histidine kinase